MSEQDHSTRPSDAWGTLAPEVAERVHSVIAAAEEAASAILREADQRAEARREEADADAQRHLEEARARAERLVAERMQRLSELSDSILQRAEMVLERLDRADSVKRQLESLARTLGEAAERVSRESGEVLPPLVHEESSPAPASAAKTEVVQLHRLRRSEPGTGTPPPDGGSARSTGARLVALQMAVAGSDRDEVAAHLRRTFEVQDLTAILDDVFGAGRTQYRRVPEPDDAS